MMISVIIATYNAEKTIERALNSVFCQTGCSIECIVIDGLSTDNTKKILESVKQPNYSFISERDSGIFDALNKGIKRASGDWIYVLGADDELLPDAFHSISQIPQIDQYDIVYGDTIDRYDDGHLRYPKSKDYHMIRFNMFCCHQGMFMKRQMMLDLGLFDIQYRLEADVDLTLRAYQKGYKFLQIQKPIAFFNMGGSTGTKSIRFDKEMYEIQCNNKANLSPFLAVGFIWIKDIIKRKILKL